MPADFCLRLALGMTACLLLLAPGRTARAGQPGVKPLASATFFRTQLLVVLGFTVGALLWLWGTGGWALLVCLLVAAAAAFLGSVVWSLERSPGAVALLVLTCLALCAALWQQETAGDGPAAARLAGAFGSALLLGAAVSAMLMGHNYLITPTMSLTPLFRLLAVLAVTLVVRAAADGFALAEWTGGHSLTTLKGDAALWLPVRWLVGLAGPAVLGAMAWQTARIRSTQSATGILYVVVICTFLGELTGLLLRPAGLTL
ncbi:MAG: hypothetical protein U0736_08045 [Gemmataceae bacterium]